MWTSYYHCVDKTSVHTSCPLAVLIWLNQPTIREVAGSIIWAKTQTYLPNFWLKYVNNLRILTGAFLCRRPPYCFWQRTLFLRYGSSTMPAIKFPYFLRFEWLYKLILHIFTIKMVQIFVYLNMRTSHVKPYSDTIPTRFRRQYLIRLRKSRMA